MANQTGIAIVIKALLPMGRSFDLADFGRADRAASDEAYNHALNMP
jgi:hypothetical protein